jgi:hypothetical protein
VRLVHRWLLGSTSFDLRNFDVVRQFVGYDVVRVVAVQLDTVCLAALRGRTGGC